MEGILIPVIIVVTIGFIAGVILTIASKVMAVSVDEKIEKLIEAMPGANCGACGFAGCDNYAVALGEDKNHNLSTSLCPVGGDSLSKDLAKILGVEATSTDPRIAYVACKGGTSQIKRIMTHDKDWSCAAASQLYGGQMECSYGCLGHGDCIKACPYDAIKLVDKVAEVDRNLCIGCGICLSFCPKDIIKLMPKNKLTFVACNSTAKGGETRKACKVGCLGCMKCVKVCTENAITVENNLAKIDHDLCIDCGLCTTVCPTESVIKLIKKELPRKTKKKGPLSFLTRGK